MAAERRSGPVVSAADPQTRMGTSPADLVALAIAVVVPLSLHLRALRAPFFADDWLFLDHVRRTPLQAWFTTADPLGNYFRPLSRTVWFALVDRIGNGTPFAFHALNLALFMLSALMLYALARRLAGRRAALVAVALFVPTACADVPIAWASGSQDLLALALSLAGLLQWMQQRRVIAAALFLCAALCKEVALVMPAVALLIGGSERDPLTTRTQRAWPLALAFAGWAALWWSTRTLRPAAGHEVGFELAHVGIALARLPQAFLGLEWAPGTPWRWLTAWPAAGTLTLAALIGMLRNFAGPERTRPGAIGVGLAWAILATLPVAAVIPIWSSYFSLMAVAGVALALGALCQRLPDLALAALILLVSLGAQHARTLPAFATERMPWTTASHVNPAYIERSGDVVTKLLGSLQRQRPKLAPGSTVFFAQVPASAGFQMGDGALLRIAYRDTSLHSHFLTDFSNARASRGPVLFFVADADTLVDHTADPMVLPSLVYSMIVADRPQAALDALDLARNVSQGNDPMGLQNWRPWPLLALGRRDDAVAAIHAAGMDTALASANEAAALLAAPKDTVAQIVRMRAAVQRHAMDPRLQGRLAQLLMTRADERVSAVVATYAVRTLRPDDPGSWRNFAVVQLAEGRQDAARASLEHYFRIGGAAAAADASAHQVHDNLRREASAVLTQEPTP